MKRIEKIEKYIRDETINSLQGFTASEIASKLEIRRNDASADLNKLFKSGILKKSTTRPVKYFLSDNTNDSSKESLEDNEKSYSSMDVTGSLEPAFQLAKAAVSYPPHGLNTLITGETGVGKNYLAEKIWSYAVENNLLSSKDRNIPFISFNCAEYADNPQLLLSHLFGYTKGAFTGADKDSQGLVEAANNGILFLDEIHRLPPAGQELLFSLIDNGMIKRLGDKTDRKVNVMLICATTEDINTSLLKTFMRRIPVVIHLPNLSERPINEKLDLIISFFRQEAQRINMDIWIPGEVLKALITFQPKGNIGELRNTVNLCCAKSYLNFLSLNNKTSYEKDKEKLVINLYDLPSKAYHTEGKINLPETFFNIKIFSEGLLVSSNESKETNTPIFDKKYSINLYNYIEKKIRIYKNLRLPNDEVEHRVTLDLDTYYKNIIKRMMLSSDNQDDKLIDSIISSVYKDIANDILYTASLNLDRTYSNGLKIAFALHIQEFVDRNNIGEIIYNPNLESIKTAYASEMNVLYKIEPSISQKLGFSIPEDELGFWAMFLRREETAKSHEPSVGLVIANHGVATASNMANFVNEVMSTDLIYSIDAPIYQSVSDVFSKLCNTVKKANRGKGVLILADMGSFIQIEDKLKADTGIPCKIIPNVSSILVLEAAKNILSSNQSLDEIYKHTYYDYYQSFCNQFKAAFTKRTFDDNASNHDNTQIPVIITVCATGEGAANIIKQIIIKSLTEENIDANIINASINEDIEQIVNLHKDNIKLIIGGINPNIKGIPFLDITNVFSSEGLAKIKSMITNIPFKIDTRHEKLMDNDIIFDLIRERLSYFAPSLNAQTAMNACQKLCDKIKEDIAPSDIGENYFPSIALHLICMLERINKGDAQKFPEWGTSYINQNYQLYVKFKNILSEVCNPIGFEIPKSEICYFLQVI